MLHSAGHMALGKVSLAQTLNVLLLVVREDAVSDLVVAVPFN